MFNIFRRANPNATLLSWPLLPEYYAPPFQPSTPFRRDCWMFFRMATLGILTILALRTTSLFLFWQPTREINIAPAFSFVAPSIFVLTVLGIFLVILSLDRLSMKRSSWGCEMRDDGIMIRQNGEKQKLRWSQIRSFATGKCEGAEDYWELALFLKNRRTIRVVIPDPELVDQIQQIIPGRSGAALVAMPPRELPVLNPPQLFLMYALTICVAMLSGMLIGLWGSPSRLLYFMSPILILGPGTLGLMLLFGRSAFTRKGGITTAFMFNIMGCFLILLWWIPWVIHRACVTIESGPAPWIW